ncbi:MAG: class I SAM-dependent methyltransferase [Thermomicrobiales bacterium]|nr:class I SAM-dependent methyltransferase [Thermomicrobiales bacterium]
MIRRSPLHPDPQELYADWARIVAAEKEQVERLREWQEADYYAPVAHHFAVDPHRTDDPVLELLYSLGGPGTRWLDIGAGGGRYALPLAVSGRPVVAVEPSESMRNVLQEGIEEHNVSNIEILAGRWPAVANGVSVDAALMAHVGYDLPNIGEVLDAAEAAASQWCCVITMDRAPSGGFVNLWEAVHGEERYLLPAMRELLQVLLARGATPEVHIIERQFRAMDEDDMRASARRRLWLSEGSEKDRKLQSLIDDMLARGESDWGFPNSIVAIVWQPPSATLGDGDAGAH